MTSAVAALCFLVTSVLLFGVAAVAELFEEEGHPACFWMPDGVAALIAMAAMIGHLTK